MMDDGGLTARCGSTGSRSTARGRMKAVPGRLVSRPKATLGRGGDCNCDCDCDCDFTFAFAFDFDFDFDFDANDSEMCAIKNRGMPSKYP